MFIAQALNILSSRSATTPASAFADFSLLSIIATMGFFSLLLVAILLPYSISIQSGVYFERLANMIHTTEHHNVVLKLEFSHVIHDLRTLDTKLQTAIKHANRTSPFYDHFVRLITSLRTNVHQLQTHTVNFFQTFSGYKEQKFTRSKRSNILGTVTARILGLVTDDDLASIIDTVNSNSHKEEGIINRVVSTMKITSTHLCKIDLAISKVNLAVTSLKNHFTHTEANLAKLDSAFVLAESLNFFTASVEAVDRTIRQTLLDLQEVRLTGKISSSLLPPSRLQKVLQDLLNYQLFLVFPPSANYVPSYFKICSATVKMSNLDFLVIIRVPLQTDSSYDLYRLRAFAIPYENSKWTRRVTDIPEYLGIRADRKVAMVMDDLSNCISAGNRFLCSPHSHFLSTTQETCPIALFRESQNIDELCDFVYAYNMPTEFVKVSNRWVGTSHSAQKAEEVCQNYTKSIQIPAGLASIPVKAGCKIITQDFVLPPFGLEGSSNLRIEILSHPFNFTPLNHLELEPLAKIKLQNLKPFKTSDLKFLKLRQAIYPSAYWSSANSSHLALTIIVTIGLISVATYLTFLKCHSRIYVANARVRRPTQPRNRHRLSPMNLFNRVPTSFPSTRSPMPTPATSTINSPTASNSDFTNTLFEPCPPPPTTRAPKTPVPSNARNTLQIPKFTLTTPDGSEPEYLEMVIYCVMIITCTLTSLSNVYF